MSLTVLGATYLLPSQSDAAGYVLIVASTVLALINTIIPTGTFWLYAAFGIIGILFFYRGVPETRGRSLEEIEADMARRTSGAEAQPAQRGSPRNGLRVGIIRRGKREGIASSSRSIPIIGRLNRNLHPVAPGLV